MRIDRTSDAVFKGTLSRAASPKLLTPTLAKFMVCQRLRLAESLRSPLRSLGPRRASIGEQLCCMKLRQRVPSLTIWNSRYMLTFFVQSGVVKGHNRRERMAQSGTSAPRFKRLQTKAVRTIAFSDNTQWVPQTCE